MKGKTSFFGILFLFGMISGCALPVTAAASADRPIHCRLDVSVDPKASKVSGVMEIQAEAGRELTLYPNKARILELQIDGVKMGVGELADKDEIVLRAMGPVRLRYETTVKDPEDNLLTDQDIVLKYAWYPVVDGYCTYEVRALLPGGFVALSEGEKVENSRQGDKTLLVSRLTRPYSDAITLIASKRFAVVRDALGDIEINTYLFREDARHAARLIEEAKRYLTLYQTRIGPYPYRRFSIVEHAMSSAFSMPTFILMTEKYINQERIEETPLGHEIVHQWFGNSVFADYDKGNWHEGLTIYFADHLYEEERREDALCRKRILIGYENYVRDNNVFPLSKFSEWFDFASRSIGYGKSAMLFHMLRRQFGDELFYGAIRRFVRDNAFRVATWEELEAAFAAETGQELSYYFRQWIHDVGLPELDLADVETEQKGELHEVRFTVRQRGSAYRLNVPVTFYFSDGAKKSEHLTVAGETSRFAFLFPEPPMEVVLDENNDVFRKLTTPEIRPTIERLISDEKSIILASPAKRELYAGFAELFDNQGAVLDFMKERPDASRRYLRGGPRKVSLEPKGRASLDSKRMERASSSRAAGDAPAWKSRQWEKTAASKISKGGSPGFRRQTLKRSAGRVKDDELASASLLVLGADNPMLKRLGIVVPPIDAGFGIIVQKNPLNPRKVVAVVAGKSHEEIALAQGQITDYRKYSTLSFDRGKLVDKTIEKAENGIRKTVANYR